MAKALVVHKGRANVVAVNLGFSVTGETLTSEIRERADQDSPLIATWVITVVNAGLGTLSLFLDDSANEIEQSNGFMDIKRLSGGQPLAIFDEPLAVELRGTVTV